MSRSRIRFLFTQLSAFVVFFLTAGIICVLLGRAVGFPLSAQERPAPLFLLAVIGIGCIGILAMVLWGKLLVLIGVLTKEEARGYPFSKPWEPRRDVF
jgi:hypothetical protein